MDQTAVRTGRDLAAERVRIRARQRDVALAMAVSRQRVNQLEQAALPSRGAVDRYLEALASLRIEP